jgi:malate dehydrogenase (oxaloacetate-decarboxylating)
LSKSSATLFGRTTRRRCCEPFSSCPRFDSNARLTDDSRSCRHFEDFGVSNAARLLAKYRPIQSCFNDDMQGTAAVVLAALISAVKVTKSELKDQRIVSFGFGTAGYGIADGIRTALMLEAGLTSEEVRKIFWCIDRPGLLTTEHSASLRPGQENFIRDASEVESWERDEEGRISLLEVVKQAKPTILIGCSTMSGAFTEEVCREMAKHCERPIIFPLSSEPVPNRFPFVTIALTAACAQIRQSSPRQTLRT